MSKAFFGAAILLTVLTIGTFVFWYVYFTGLTPGNPYPQFLPVLTIVMVEAILAAVCWFLASRNP